jgi:erythromycin esterase-like protein
MTDSVVVARLRQEVERLRAIMNGDAAEIIRLLREVERLQAEVAILRTTVAAEIKRLTAEVEEWKERCAAERRDHEATIAHCDRVMNEGP